ncbi:MAG TPA: hypothetical protein VL172_02595 [Kofleriaceae bacterium]|nr:hypothetical protein [Kofleriaceae bacterium]
MRLSALVLALSVASTGCLSHSHVIPHDELLRLSQVPPDQRGRQVRVVQGFQSEDDPPEAPYAGRESGGGAVGVVVVSDSPAPGPAPSSGVPDNSAKAKSDKAYVYVILAAALAVGLAVTEGSRYDGWVQLHPMHPVHLLGPNGEYTWRPLAQIDPETAMWARKAIVRPSEGPWVELGRRPLSRAGLSYAMTLGYAEMPSELGTEQHGFLSHIAFGYFPEQTIGLYFDIGLGWGYNPNGDTIVDSRYVLQAQVMPVAAGKLHLGLFGQGGIAGRFEDNVPDGATRGTIYGGGAIAELELTTRLGLIVRGGVTHIFDFNSADLGVGIAVY